MKRLDLRVAAIGVGVVLAFALAGCASGGSGAASAGPVLTTHVELPRSYRFDPPAISVSVGSTVTWTNSDNFTHSVQFDGDAAPGAVMRPGQSTSRTFDTPGSYAYICTFHPQDMKGVVVVTAEAGSVTP